MADFERKIVGIDELLAAVRAARAAGKTIVQCHGCFDIVHPGHIRYLEFARRQGDVLIVTGKGLFKVTRHLQVEALLETNWWMFHPGALALGRDSTAYVGMRGAVVEVQLSTRPPKQTWLYPF